MTISYLNLTIFVFLGLIEPYTPSYLNRKENFNEFQILMMTDVLFIFTSWCNDVDFRYETGGWCYIFIFVFCIIFNLNFIGRELYYKVKMVVIKYYKILKFKYGEPELIKQTRNSDESIFTKEYLEHVSLNPIEPKKSLIVEPDTPNILKMGE